MSICLPRLDTRAILLGVSLSLVPGVAFAQAAPNAATDWSLIVQHAIHNASAPRSAGTSEILHATVMLAMYDATVAVTGGYRPYAAEIPAAPGADLRAAVATAAATVKPSSATPSKLPDVMRHAISACRPIVSASLFMMQPPANTSAVRASTYSPVMRPLSSADRDAAEITNAAMTNSGFMAALFTACSSAVMFTSGRMHRASVGPKRLLRARAPIRSGVVAIVERELTRIGHCHHVHALVPQVLAMMLVDER